MTTAIATPSQQLLDGGAQLVGTAVSGVRWPAPGTVTSGAPVRSCQLLRAHGAAVSPSPHTSRERAPDAGDGVVIVLGDDPLPNRAHAF